MNQLLFRFLRRLSWQSGLWWFALSLAVCVASVFSVHLVAERLQQSLKVSGRNFLAADLVVQSANESPQLWRTKAKNLGLDTSVTAEFSSMLIAGEQMQLASVKAVSEEYPFYGQLVLHPAAKISQGGIWLSDTLLKLLSTSIGETLTLGNTSLIVKGVVNEEPDQNFNPFSFAPRAIVSFHDLSQAGVLLPGSRISYRLLLHGNEKAQQQFTSWIKPQLKAGDQLLTSDKADRRVSLQLDRSEHFFRLASLVAVLLGGMAMYISANHFSTKTRTLTALLKSLGASRKQIIYLIAGLLLLLATGGVLLGLLGGWLLHGVMVSLLGDAIPSDLAPISIAVFIQALIAALVLAALLICIPIMRLLSVPAMQVLRHDHESSKRTWMTLPVLLIVILAMNYLVLRDLKMLIAFIVSVVVLMGILAIGGWLLLRFVPVGRIGSPYFLAIQQWRRHPWSFISQLSGIALPLMLVGVVVSVRGEILSGFQSFLPAGAPNRFMLNISDIEKPSLETLMAERQIPHSLFYPIVRGRLVAINQQAVTQKAGDTGRKGIHRELTMTALAQLPNHSPVIAGQTWTDAARKQVSISDNVAKDLDLKIGDQLTFQVDGQSFQVGVSSIRKVDWQSLQPNFFMIFTPDVFQNFIVSWMTSYRIDTTQTDFDISVAKQYPTITILNIDSILQKLKTVLSQLAKAVSVLMGLVSLAGGLVLIVLWMSQMQQREKNLALMRILGATQRQLRHLLYYQAALLGLLGGIVAAISTECIRWLLQQQWSNQPWQLLPSLWGVLPLLGFTIVLCVSHWMLQPLLKQTLASKIRSS